MSTELEYQIIRLDVQFPLCRPVTIKLRDFGDGLVLPGGGQGGFLTPDGLMPDAEQYDYVATLYGWREHLELERLRKQQETSKANASQSRKRESRCDIYDLRDYLLNEFDHDVHRTDQRLPN